MKLKQFLVTFTREIDFTVFAPPDTERSVIETVARDLAKKNLPGFDPCVSWEASVSGPMISMVSDEDLVPVKNKNGYLNVNPDGILAQEDVLVLSDDKTDLVLGMDASWWQLKV